MKKQTVYLFLIFCFGVLALANKPQPAFILLPQKTVYDDSAYIAELRLWHKKRMESLKSESGWLNLAGLFWLKEGQNSFGTDKTNAVVFPKGAAVMGQFTLTHGEISVETDPKAEITANKEPITQLKLFPTEKNIAMESGSLRWFAIKRGDKYGIRLRDLESETLKHFTDVETYPIDKKWRVKAQLKTSSIGKTVNITDVLGHITPQVSPGTLVFKLNGKTYNLDAIAEGDELFILFADATNGKETYGSGRFLYTNKPDANGVVYLDFNKAINPPCAFTPFATCPLPPKQNQLAIEIGAGEKMYGEH
jgi:uncharacterized protein